MLIFLTLLIGETEDFKGESNGRRMKIKEDKIFLVPVGEIDVQILSFLAGRLEPIFHCPVAVYEGIEIPEEAYNPARKQYHSSLILQKMRSVLRTSQPDRLFASRQEKFLGIADVDLYAEGLNFVFGEALLGGQMAVISLARLRQSFYGLPENKSLFAARALKEAVHEIGHLYGLRHCQLSDCVMYFSNSLLDTDRKSSSFCPRCQKLLD